MNARRALVGVIALVIAGVSLSPPRADAAMMPTAVLQPEHAAEDAAAQEALAARLAALGVDHPAARERVAALTPGERAELAARLDALPAGGDLVGALAFAALVLLMTDILGYTDVYPFVTRTINGEKASTAKAADCVPDATAAVTR